MAKFNGGFGGNNNMAQIMRQAQKMQQNIAQAQEELADTEVVATAGGGGSRRRGNVGRYDSRRDKRSYETRRRRTGKGYGPHHRRSRRGIVLSNE